MPDRLDAVRGFDPRPQWQQRDSDDYAERKATSNAIRAQITSPPALQPGRRRSASGRLRSGSFAFGRLVEQLEVVGGQVNQHGRATVRDPLAAVRTCLSDRSPLAKS